jgi:hypothetical protein
MHHERKRTQGGHRIHGSRLRSKTEYSHVVDSTSTEQLQALGTAADMHLTYLKLVGPLLCLRSDKRNRERDSDNETLRELHVAIKDSCDCVLFRRRHRRLR